MKILCIIIICFSLFMSMRYTQSKKFIAYYKCKQYLLYDSTKKINVRFSENDSGSITHENFAEEFNKSFISNSFFTFSATTHSFDNDSALVLCDNFQFSSPVIRPSFNKVNYLYRKDSLFKQEGFEYVFIDNWKNKPIFKFLKDSVILTSERKTIMGYECVIAKSAFDQSVQYYISNELPKTVNPGIMLQGAFGAVLGIQSEKYLVQLEMLEAQ
ncbi:MAG: hypothetical protein LC134_00165 [Chitinophagales bacterium]|nr:hypothetical protein [Chitinophagales bacterium]